MNLVNAQQARRVLDRIVGFELSPILWKKVRPSLSAGRVQSVAVRLIVDRERAINEFVPEPSFRVIANFILPDGTTILKAELDRRLKNKEEVYAFLKACQSATFTIENITRKPMRRSPAPPFTTSTLQQEAALKLGYSVSQTMRIAQMLYESGLITYMRTDSFNLSDLALGTAKETILNTYGEKYYKFRQYHTKNKGAQEAHEAIRPTYIANAEIKGTEQEKRLYNLIRKRTIACQMADAELERTTISVSIGGMTERFVASGEVVVFDGFLQVYKESTDDENENETENKLLPRVNLHEELRMQGIVATERFTQRPARYTEASLVRQLENLGIGRPSTYAPTIQTVLNRGYVVKGDKEGKERTYAIISLSGDTIQESSKTEIIGADRNKLMPTDIGIVVNDFLMEYFQLVMDYNFTANVEKELDAIAEGEEDWTKVIDGFYKIFHPTVEEAIAIHKDHRIGERMLGNDPKSGKPVFVKIGRFGPMAQIGDSKTDKEEKPQFATLMKGQSIETITLDEALKLFELPRSLGEFEGKTVVVGVGRFGPFIRHDGKFVSIPKTLNPLSISLDEAVTLIQEKRTQEEQRHIKTFEEEPELEILNGRFGPYIAYKGKNYKIPKSGYTPTEMTLEECLALVKEAEDKPATKRRVVRKKK